MDQGNAGEAIADIEQRIEALAERIERCRKVMLFARIAIAVGAALLVATFVGLFRFHPTALVVAITAILGGIVLYGSNGSTSAQAAAELKTAEAERAELIGRMQLRVVGNDG
jgi:hypothetical protein